ncbi:MAG TPA: hypothetical protein VL049_24615 [Candidatus Dormibacteraeota bacterium]|nr:hypothetical protein [Candidatus Dormibacteraeota bacterium]
MSAACPPDALQPPTVECRAAAGACDVAESCDGVGSACPADAFLPATTTCRAAAGTCDVAESCTGTSADCPADAFAPATVECRAAAGPCDLAENCPATSASCPPDAKSTALCRAAAGGCDVAESCDGIADACPADGVLPASTVCRAAAGACDVAESCDGIGVDCPADVLGAAGVPCRPAAGACDVAETCTGTSVACPADALQPSTVECRASAGPCDVAESCTGAAPDCPADAKSTALCRAAASVCDLAEYCDGSGDACPADVFQPDGTACSDGRFCNGLETCRSGVCFDGPDPCLICEETQQRCLNEFCPATPLPCRTAEKSVLLIRNNQDDDMRDRLTWKIVNGPPTSLGDLSDPQRDARYTLCLYAGTAQAQTLIQEMSVPPRPFDWTFPASGWSAGPHGRGFSYTDPPAVHGGAYRITLRPSLQGRTRILVRGRGVNLGDPLYDRAALPVVTQLINHATGVCWQGTSSYPQQNDADGFRAVH